MAHFVEEAETHSACEGPPAWTPGRCPSLSL